MKYTLLSSIILLIGTGSSTTTNATLLPLDETNNHVTSSKSSSSFETVWIPNCNKNKHKWRPQCKCRYPINWESDICQGTNWWNKTQIVTNVNKIVGGGGEFVTPLTTYPWFVRLMNRNDDDDGSYLGCGGMLVAPDYVLTAAHCVSPGDASSLAVLIGAVCLDDDDNNNCNQPSQVINVESVTNHPWYFQNTMNNDFALLKLVSRSNNVTPVEMDQGSYVTSYSSNKRKLYAIGFGTLSYGSPEASQLKHVELEFVPRAECNLANTYNSAITDYMMCATDPDQDSCLGDSGGPLWDSENNVVVGIISWGYGCALPQYPGVYAQISSRWAWIKATICANHSNPLPTFCDIAPTAPTAVPTPTSPSTTPPSPTPPTKCSSDQLAVEITITTDAYPNEIVWTIQSSDGSSHISDPFKTAFETYSTTLCLDSSICHTFEIDDSCGRDGIQYHAGGALTVTVNQIVVVSNPPYNTSFDYTFGDCSAPTPCANENKRRFKLELTTDNQGSETSFKVMQKRPNGKFNRKVFAGSNFDSSADYTRSKCLPQQNCYRLVVYDSAGDGICCEFGEGSFQGYWDGVAVPNLSAQFTSGSVARSRTFGNCW